MPFGFDTKQQVVNYIVQERHRQSRYAIDSYLLQAGCSPALVDQVWREMARPKRYSRLIVAWSFLNFKIALWILWFGVSLGLVLGCHTMEIGLAVGQLAPLMLWIFPLLPLLWGAISLKIKRIYLFSKWTRWLLRFGIIFFLIIIIFPRNDYIGDTFCAAPYPYALDQLVTSESHFILVDSFVSPFGDDPYSNSGYYRVELYQCNAFGLGCHLIVQEDFPQIHFKAWCGIPQLHLQAGPNGQVEIVQKTSGNY